MIRRLARAAVAVIEKGAALTHDAASLCEAFAVVATIALTPKEEK